MLAITGCATSSDETTPDSTPTTVSSPTSTFTVAPESLPATTQPSVSATGPATTTIPAISTPALATAAPPDAVVGRVIRFTGQSATVDVTVVEDNATARSLLSRLPLTVEFEEFNGREKISYPPGGLDVVESGHDPENGDLIYYVPWGNLGFYYNAAGIGFDDDVVVIGRYEATPEQLSGLEGNVTISTVIE